MTDSLEHNKYVRSGIPPISGRRAKALILEKFTHVECVRPKVSTVIESGISMFSQRICTQNWGTPNCSISESNLAYPIKNGCTNLCARSFAYFGRKSSNEARENCRAILSRRSQECVVIAIVQHGQVKARVLIAQPTRTKVRVCLGVVCGGEDVHRVTDFPDGRWGQCPDRAPEQELCRILR